MQAGPNIALLAECRIRGDAGSINISLLRSEANIPATC